MDRRERLGDLETSLLAVMAGNQATIWTALPGTIQAYDPAKMTVSVKPAIQARVRKEDGTFTWAEIPLLVDCPVIFPNGGGFTLSFPVVVGDECLVIFSSRCIDSWWQLGASSGPQVQAELRMHDLSDGFALMGPRSQPRVLSPAASTDGIELRSDDRTSYIKLDDAGNLQAEVPGNASVDAGGDVYVTAGTDLVATASGEAQVTAPTIKLTGNVTVTGTLAVVGNASVSGALTNAGTNIGKTHIHTGGTLPGGFTGAPT